MKKTLILMAILIFSLDLTGCSKNNLNKNDVVNRDQNVTKNNITNNKNNNAFDNRTKMRVADNAAKKVADLPEVDTANVIVTNNNAYVAVKLSPTSRNKGTYHIEHKISQRVKSTDRDIDNVYVSENPDFYDRINTYASDIRNGKPVSGFFNEFTETIRRVFPKAK
ncbi:YhcN/YlaJ family sporulation lipoprotein [Neobacillus cucumis]|uniref:YhcN/YlaJ family sporulation lipoprotein n=1 Tax=Neobacillus cucumis TaxID=1740721 RepID=UPI0028535B3F|nr:YhcN/YlaJ family sporulation lipoprotein [Neobacillus cucumis]MDR4947901.1 YhcN/YlaJ family sporulation lipoprotein [Neobacillus cucumis]